MTASYTYGADDLTQALLMAQQPSHGGGDNGHISRHRTSEVALALEGVRERRKIAESRHPLEASGKLWRKEIDRQKAIMKKEHEEARKRNEELRQQARKAGEHFESVRRQSTGRLGKTQVEVAKKQYLDHIQALYPQWCREVEAAANEQNRRLGNSILDVRKRRLLAAERFASQMAIQKEIASKEEELLKTSSLRLKEQQQHAEAAHAAVKQAHHAPSTSQRGTSDPQAQAGTAAATLTDSTSASASMLDSTVRLAAFLRESLPSQRAPQSAAFDPDIPPESPPPKAYQPPSAPTFGGTRWGAGAAYPAGGNALATGGALAGVPLTMQMPDGTVQTVLLPVLPNAAGQPPAVETSQYLSGLLHSPRGNQTTPREGVSGLSPRSANKAEVPAEELHTQLVNIKAATQHPRYGAAELADSVDFEPSRHAGEPPPGGLSHGQAELSLVDQVRMQSGSSVSSTSEEGADKIMMEPSPAFSSSTPNSAGMRVSKGSAALRSISHSKPAGVVTAQLSTSHSGVGGREAIAAARAAHVRSGSISSADGEPQILGLPKRQSSIGGSSDGALSAEPSTAPSLFMGIGPGGSAADQGGSGGSPSSSLDGSDLGLRSSVDSKSGRSQRRPSRLGAANLGDSIMSDLTEDSAVSFEEEDLAAQRAAWNQELQRREALIAEEKAAEEAKQFGMVMPFGEPDSPPAAAASSKVGTPGSPGLQRSASAVIQRPHSRSGSESSGVAAAASDGATLFRSPSASFGQRTRASGPRLGIFGFGGGLGGSGSSNGRPSTAPTGGKRLAAVSSIVSRAFDGSDSEGSDDGGDKVVAPPTRAASVSLPSSGASQFPTVGFHQRRASATSSAVPDTSDEFDF